MLAVIEAKKKSGTLHTVEYALAQGRDVFAVPGRVTDFSSSACNDLINDGAGVLTDAGALLNYFGISRGKSRGGKEKNKFTRYFKLNY